MQEATLDLIRPWAAEGVLPSLEKMMQTGVCGPIQGKEPLTTPHSWANILTGRGAGHHGVFDFWQRDEAGRFSPTTRKSLRVKPVWTLLQERGLKPAMLNVPLTYPPEASGGFMMSALDAPGITRAIAMPPDIFDQITSQFGSYRPGAIFPGGRKKSDYLEIFQRETARQAEVYAHLLKSNPWDFAIVYFADAAMAQHYFWADMMSPDPTDPYRTVLPMAYRCLDQAVGRLQAAAGPETTVFVVSECGAGPIRYGVQINTWLCQQGFLTRKRAGVARPGRWSGPVSSIFKRGVRLGSGFAKHHLPQSIRFWLNQLLPSLKGSQADSALRGVDWARTKAFAQGKEGHLFINLRGRDPKGIVAPGAEYETVRQDLIDRLGRLRDPDTGEPAVTRVCRREELFEGPMVHLAADLFIEWRDDMYMPAEQELEPQKVFVTRYRQGMSWPTSGSHRVAGVLIASGPLIRPASEVLDATIFDLLPTWLRLLEQPIPEELEGRVLDEALN